MDNVYDANDSHTFLSFGCGFDNIYCDIAGGGRGSGKRGKPLVAVGKARQECLGTGKFSKVR